MRASWFIVFLSVVAAEHVNDKIRSIYDSCTTRQCVQDLMELELNIFNNINMSVDPCDNFYEFACGNFDNVPTDLVQRKEHKNIYAVSDISYRIKHLIETMDSLQLPRPFNILKNLMTACNNLNESHWSSYHNRKEDKLDYLNELISKLGGWPLLQGDKWNETNFDWIDFINKAYENGVDFDVFLSRKFWPHRNHTFFLYLDAPTVELDYKEGKKISTNKLNAYVRLVSNVTEFLGSNKTLTKEELKGPLAFEKKLHRISNSYYTYPLTNGNKSYGMTVKEVIENWPSIDWMKFLNPPTLPRPYFKNESIIFIGNHKFVTNFEKLLKKTPKKVLANYAMWKTVQKIIPFIHSTTLFTFLNTYLKVVREANVQITIPQCSTFLQQHLSELELSYYVHHYPLDRKVKSRINLMAADVSQKLISIINRTNTLDDESRNRLIRDIESIQLIIGYPEVLADDKKMEEYYQGLEVTSTDYSKGSYNAIAFYTKKQWTSALKPSDEISWKDILHSKIVTTANAFNLKDTNIISIPLLEDFFFSINRPNYSNYGLLGFIIGHEIGHSVDFSKKFIDDYGFERDRWSSFSEDQFHEKEKCLIEQLSNFTVRGTEGKLDGTFLLAENLADHIGIRAAYSAYQDWVKVHGTEPTFPNLPYNSNQMFWLSYANQRCTSKWVLENMNTEDPHPPNDKRLIVPLSNTPEFSKDFNCPLGSKMNPVKKCNIFE